MEVINLNLIPNGTNPVVHCSQYDEGREFRFNLFDGASVFVLDGTEDITCDIKKPDGNIVTAAVPNTEDDYIIVTTTLQMCACSGNSLGTINISKGGANLYTLNFVLYCERSPLENGIESESSIHNLEEQIAEAVAEEVATQYDSGNVIFDNEPTDTHGIGYTVTSEGIKTAIDNAFDYDNTASGSLVHITDGADNIPVKSLTSEIVAVESGSGEKSLDNPYTISGFDSGIITVTDNDQITNTYTFAFGQTVYGGHFDNKGNLVVTHGEYTLNGTETFNITGDGKIIYTDVLKDSAKMGTTVNIGELTAICERFDNHPEGVSFRTGNYDNTFCLGSSYLGATARLAFRCSSWSSAQDAQDYFALNNTKIICELANPIVLPITSQDIPTLLGENNIFSNCGDVEVTYYTNKANDILEFIDSEIGKKNGTNIPIEENNPDSIKDYVDNGLSGKADTSDTYTKTEVDNLLNDKQNSNVLNIVKHYDTGTSSDAITDIITEYGKVNMVFAFDVPLGYFTGCLTFANDNMGSGFIVLSTTGRFWVVSYVSGTITLTELT